MQAHEAVEFVNGPTLAAAFGARLNQGAMGGLDGFVAAEQPALPEQVVARAGAVDALIGSELGCQRGS